MDKVAVEEKNDKIEGRVLFSWEASARPFKKRNREFFTTVAIIVFLICLILIFAGQWFLVAAILSLTFLIYVLSTVSPETVKNEIKESGVKNAGNFYKWDDLSRFWFEDRYGERVLMIETNKGVFSLMALVLVGVDEEKIKKFLKDKIKFRAVVEKNSLDHASEWIGKRITFEK